MQIIYRYRQPALSEGRRKEVFALAREMASQGINDIQTEYCYYIESVEPLGPGESEVLKWLLSETFESEYFSERSFLEKKAGRRGAASHVLIEVGPRMNFTTSWSTNAVSVCHSCGVTKISRIERFISYLTRFSTINWNIPNL